MLLSKPFVLSGALSKTLIPSSPRTRSNSRERITVAMANSRSRRTISALEARISLVFALASQTSSLSQRLLLELATETSKYLFPKQFEIRNLEEAFMAVPDLETVKFKVLCKRDQYEIRETELSTFLNTAKEKMEMTTPVLTTQYKSAGEKMDMTTPVITKRVDGEDKWQMSFVMPSKYGSNLPVPKDPSVRIREVPKKIIAVVAFSGFVSDEEVKQRESKLRDALKSDKEFQVKEGSLLEVAQYNPPFTLPFQRRNEIALEVKRKEV